jgi:tetratricopeptide (TPR) repeat protein
VEFAEVLAYHYATAAGMQRDAGGVVDTGLRRSALDWSQRASDDARRRSVLKKAQRLAEEALGFAVEPLERVEALATLAEAFFADYIGDLTWRYFREAALLRASIDPPDGRRVAYLAARACDVTIRWPGSMTSLPSEPQVRELLELGLANIPAGDSEEQVRLLGVRAGWPFSFPDADLDESEAYEAAGVEAAEMAMRLNLPSLASGVLDNAGAAWGAVGNYLRTKPLWERRGKIIPLVTDAFEVGDYWAMGAWMQYELGDYETAMRCIADGETAVASQGPDNIHVHLDAWKVAAQHRLGRWDEALEWFERVRDLLDERRDRPPYFAAHAYGAAAQIHTARGDVVQSDQLTQILSPLLSGASGRLYPWLLRLLLLRGDLEAARALERPTVWRVHAGDAYESESELVYAIGDRARANELLVEMRRHGAESGTLPTVGAFANRLEGRLAVTDGDLGRAILLLAEAVDGFDAIRCPYERSLTMLDVGTTQRTAGRADEARAAFQHARTTFETLGATRDLRVTDELLAG